MGDRRITRINDAIKSCMSEIIRNNIRDPRLKKLIISITKVKTSSDLSHCRIYISVFDKNQKDHHIDIISILNNASGLFRKLIAQNLDLRITPNFEFIIDDSMSYSSEIDNLIKKIKIDSNQDIKIKNIEQKNH